MCLLCVFVLYIEISTLINLKLLMKKVVLSFLIMCAFVCSLSAQEIKVKGFKPLERDLTARTLPRLDLNDDPCSVIKVIASSSDLHFEGNVMGKPVVRDGEVLVYVAEGTKNITIRSPKYGVVRYDFPQTIARQSVYELTLQLIESTANKTRILVMPNISYHTSQLSYGLMIGVVKKTGGYVKVKSDFGKVSSDYDVTNDGYISGSETLPWYSGDTKKSRFAVTGGILQRFAIPLYGYAGVGYGSRNYAWGTTDGKWAKNLDHSYSGVEAEIGFIYRLGDIAASAGVQTNSFKYFEACVGFGIMF